MFEISISIFFTNDFIYNKKIFAFSQKKKVEKWLKIAIIFLKFLYKNGIHGCFFHLALIRFSGCPKDIVAIKTEIIQTLTFQTGSAMSLEDPWVGPDGLRPLGATPCGENRC